MRYIIFDLDGTLANSGNYQLAFEETCLRMGVSRDKAAHFWHRNQGLPIAKQLARVGQLPVGSELSDEMERIFWQQVGQPPFVARDGAEQLLSDLHQQEKLLFLTTGSNQARVDQCLDQLGWRQTFHLAQATTPEAAKGPEHYQQMAASVGLPLDHFVEQAVIIGDGSFDMLSAREIGIRLRIGLIESSQATEQQQILEEAGAAIIISHLNQVIQLISEYGADPA